MSARLRVFAALVAFIVAFGAMIRPAHAAPTDVTVTVTAPEGVPAAVALDGPERVLVSKDLAGAGDTRSLTLSAGDYAIDAPDVLWEGKRYVATVTVQGQEQEVPDTFAATDRELEVAWELAEGVQDFFVTALEADSATLQWSAPDSTGVTIRRASGTKAPSAPTDGVAVPVSGSAANDTGLEAGTQYTYAAFVGDERVFTVTLGTANPGAVIDDAHVRDYSAIFFESVPQWSGDGTNMTVTWPKDAPLPALGLAVVVPRAESLPGGFVGEIVAVGDDGRTVELAPTGYSAALAYVDLIIEDMSEVPAELEGGDDGAADDGSTAPGPQRVQPKKNGLPKTGGVRPMDESAVPDTDASASDTSDNDAPEAESADTSKSKKCEPKGGFSVTFTPTFSTDGHTHIQLDKYDVFGVEFPRGVLIDMKLVFITEAKLDADVSGTMTCSVPNLPKIKQPFIVGGVPSMLELKPSASASFSGKAKVSNMGVKVSVGFEIKGSVGPLNSDVDVNDLSDVTPLEPSWSAAAEVSASAGAKLTFGPGVGNTAVGAMAGVSGEIKPFDATAKAELTASGFCSTVKIGASANIKLVAKAWLASLEAEASVKIWEGSIDYAGPWAFPSGCDKKPSTPPAQQVTDDVTGEGVDVTQSSTTGSSDQWGKVSGFVPGAETWVLSTGNISDAVGIPENFASTAMGQPGDPRLDAKVGLPTYDAASFTATVVPKGSVLHVTYVFASEEYPEYVGSPFNDVMSVTVGGIECSVVPGTTEPVAVNSINADTNAEYFVDNTSGAAGYSSAMDGLTKPLTCSVPVTPGEPVEVVISVGDTSDAVWDSAVALVDKGIWSE